MKSREVGIALGFFFFVIGVAIFEISGVEDIGISIAVGALIGAMFAIFSKGRRHLLVGIISTFLLGTFSLLLVGNYIALANNITYSQYLQSLPFWVAIFTDMIIFIAVYYLGSA